MRSLDEFAGDVRVERHLDRYTDRSGYYAFHTYDQAPVHDGPIMAADVLMANLLSLRLGWDDVIPLFATGDGRFANLRRALDDALSAARRLPALEHCTPEQATMPLLRMANEIAFGTAPHRPGRHRTWTSVTVSKVLHRLSPNIPIIDARVRAFYGGTQWAGVVRRQLHGDLVRNQAWMAPIAQRYPVRSQPMSLTRMADILIWMDGEPRTTAT